MSRVGHKANDLVESLCRSWTDKEQAHLQAGIIVRELCRAGMLVDAELIGMTVIEASGQPNSWWHPSRRAPESVVADAVTDQGGRRAIPSPPPPQPEVSFNKG